MKSDVQFLVKNAVENEDLKSLRLFANADLELVTNLLQGCPLRTLYQDEVLLVPGDANSTLYLVLGGALRVHLDSPETDPVRRVETGETVGEISLIDAKPVSAYVVADAPTSLLIVDQETFWALVNTSHAVARNMLHMVVERMRASNDLIANGQRRESHSRKTNVDTVTGLRNRQGLEDLLRRQALRSSMNRQPLSVLTVDIDNMRQFNREFGRAAGDQAIFAAAQTLQDQLRPTDIIGRLDGEKFCIILPESDQYGAGIVAARLREAIAEAVIVLADGSILPPVTISVGLADMQPFQKPHELLQAAEAALMRAKGNGRNTVSC